ncbi:MAG: ABC transporter substrate-binding protein [Actinomycetota bacterium]
MTDSSSVHRRLRGRGQRVRATSIAVLVGLAAAGCGSDDDSSAGSDTASSSAPATEAASAADPASDSASIGDSGGANDSGSDGETASAPSATGDTDDTTGTGDTGETGDTGDQDVADDEPDVADDQADTDVADDQDTAASSEPIVVEHPGGVTEVPADVQTILALDEPSGTMLLELGTPPEVIFGSFLTASTPLLAADLGVEFVAHNIEAPSIEAAAGLAPDLIVGTDHPATLRNYELWSEVAPVVLVEYSGAWEDQLSTTAQAIGADATADDRTSALEAEIERLAARIGAEFDEPPTISVIASLAGMPFFVPEVGSASGELFGRLGLARPEVQQVTGDPAFPFEFFSAELLLDHDADVVFSLGGGIYEDVSAFELFPALTGTTTIVSGDEWLATHSFAIAWMLRDIESVLFGDGVVGTADDIVDRWDEFLTLGS